MEQAHFRIQGWLVEPDLNQLSRDGHRVRITPRDMQVLICLVQSAGRVVKRDDLINTVWQEAAVSDDALNLCISRLRKAFQDDARHPQVIETIPKSGYRLIAPVEPRNAPLAVSHAYGASVEDVPAKQLRMYRSNLWRWGLGIILATLVILFLIDAYVAAAEAERRSITPRPIPLTSYLGREQHGAVSPTGNYLAFVWDEANQDNKDIYVKSLTSERPIRLTHTAGDEAKPVWSPDGQEIAYLSYHNGQCSIHLIPMLGGTSRKLTACGTNERQDLAWSADGTWMAYSNRASSANPYQITLFSLTQHTSRTLLAEPPGVLGDHSPSFAPDHETLAFVRTQSNGTSDLFRMSLTGDSTAKRLTFLNRPVHGLTWTTQGDRLIFSSARDGFFSLWQVAARGGLATRLTPPTQASLRDPLRIANTDSLSYERMSSPINIWRKSINKPDTSHRFIASTRLDFDPQFSPSGNRIAFVSSRSGQPEIWISDADGSHPFQLTTLNGPLIHSPRWSPSGDRIVFVVRPVGQTDFYKPLMPSVLYLAEVAGKKVVPLTNDTQEVQAPAWSPDGAWIYYSTRHADITTVQKIALATGEIVPINIKNAIRVVESEDGDILYYTKLGHPGLWTQPVHGGPETRLFEASNFGGVAPWTVTPKGIYLAHTRTGRQQLSFYSFAHRRLTDLVILPQHDYPAGFTVSSDGEHVLFTQAHPNESDLMLISLADVLPR